jgi:diketogulonate reductase-like aldo/keto reductase
MDRRTFLVSSAASVVALSLPGKSNAAQVAHHTKPIPSTGEHINVIGMGTWITFNVGDDPRVIAQRTEVMRTFLELGGGMVDSSPMYGSARRVVGETLSRLEQSKQVFSADKIWTSDGDEGPDQFTETSKLWGVDTFDLMQIHNLRAWEEHLPTLRRLKEAGKVRYIGITTSHGRRHADLERIMKTEPLDFVQLTYNAANRDVEQRLLPVAKDRGIAVIANRPFGGGALVDRAQQHDVPDWAPEIDCANWPQILLKYVVSHPAMTVAIPATSKVEHMRENMGAARGAMPDADMRRRIEEAVEAF